MTASTPRNPPPQSPYYSNYAQNGGISPSNGTTKLPGVPEQSNGEEAPEPKKEQRLIVVSNRLPVTIMKDANGEYQFAMSSGGLVSALSGCKKSMSFTWIGWPGKHVSCHIQRIEQKLTNRSLKPTVLLSKRDCWKSTAVTQSTFLMILPSSTTTVSNLLTSSSFKLTSRFLQLYFMATIPLPPRRDELQRRPLESIPRSQFDVCRCCRKHVLCR